MAMALSCLLLISCNSNPSVPQENSALNASSALSDVYAGVMDGVLDTPDATPHMKFSDTDNFDLLLSSSLRYKPVRTVTVNTEDTLVLSENLPERLNRWFLKLQKSGNNIYKCPVKDEQTRGLFLAALKIVGDIAYSQWKQYETYKPVSKYNAIVYIVSPTDKKVDDKLTEIQFIPNSVEMDVEGCKQL